MFAAAMPLIKVAAPYVAAALPSIINLFSSSGGNGDKDAIISAIGPSAKKMAQETGIPEEEAHKALSEALMPHVERMGGSGMGAMESLATIAGIAIPGVMGYKAVKGAMSGAQAAGKAVQQSVKQVPSAPNPESAQQVYKSGYRSPQIEQAMAGKFDTVSPIKQGGNLTYDVPDRGFIMQGPSKQTRLAPEQLPDTGNFKTLDAEYEMIGPSRGGSPYLASPAEFPKLSNQSLDEAFSNKLNMLYNERERSRMAKSMARY